MNVEDFGRMNFTGERYVPSVEGNIELEHRHRYLFARGLCRGKDVLDLASGEGYGSAMLSSVANNVVGVDIARDAVKHSQRTYVRKNLQFMVGSCAEIPLPDGTIDVVVSFETLEHHDQHDEMMAEVKRVLRPDGLLIISTPDKYRYSIEPDYKNEFHIKELFHHEFVALLRRHFADASFYGQRVAFGSFVVGKGPNVRLAKLPGQGEDLSCAEEMIDPMYWIGLASDATLPPLGSSFLEQTIDKSETVRAYAGALGQFEIKHSALQQSLLECTSEIGALRQALVARDDELANLRQDFLESTREADGVRKELAKRTADLESLRDTIAAQDEQIKQFVDRTALLNRILSSHSWRLTRPLRFGGRLLRGEWQLALNGLRSELLRVARPIYRRLPLSAVYKQKVASLAYHVAGPLLERRQGNENWRAAVMRPLTRGTNELLQAKLQPAADFTVHSPKANARGWVLVADDYPPLHDQQSGGLRLKTLIDIIGNQGWPMVFASRFTRTGLPGVLSTEVERARYEMALEAAGISRFAYGLDEVDAMLAALGTNLRYAFLSHPHVAHDFIPCVRSHCPTATIIYDMVDFHSLRIAREAALKHDAALLADAEAMKAIEMAAVRAADITIAISDKEKSAVLDVVPSAVVEAIPNIFTIKNAASPGVAKRSGLFFVGGFWHQPNSDAVIWFVEKIWPQIRSQIPECRFRIAGSNAGDEVLALARNPGVDVLGFVPDLTPLFDSARVFIAPLRYGAGVKGKVGQSLAQGLPVVTTSIGAEGMSLVDGEHALIADDPAIFANHVVHLLRDNDLWTRLQARGRALAQSSFSVEALRDKVADLFHV
jgi:O-antigen biosynthesis protein